MFWKKSWCCCVRWRIVLVLLSAPFLFTTPPPPSPTPESSQHTQLCWRYTSSAAIDFISSHFAFCLHLFSLFTRTTELVCLSRKGQHKGAHEKGGQRCNGCASTREAIYIYIRVTRRFILKRLFWWIFFLPLVKARRPQGTGVPNPLVVDLVEKKLGRIV